MIALHSAWSEDEEIDDFVVNEENDPKVTSQLQSLIQDKIGIELVTKGSVSMQGFCEKRGIRGTVRGELFYQLLHMDFKLTQASPSTFGELVISRPRVDRV